MPKFLLLRFSSIGDIVLTTPVIRCLKQQVPGAEVHVLTRKPFESTLKHNPYIDCLHTFEASPSECREALHAHRFDGIIDLQHNRRTWLMKQWLNKPAQGTYSFRKLNIEKWLLVNFKIDRLPKMHIVDRYLETVAPFGVKNDGKGLDFFIDTESRKSIDRLPDSHRTSYVAVAIGAQHATKRLPTEKMIAICKKIGRPIVLLGGKDDSTTGETIASAVGTTVVSLCGKLSLGESAALLERARVVLTHDTGLMHIAAALKRPVVSVWGNTVPEFGMTPYYGDADVASTVFQVNGLSCRPCTKIGFQKCPKGHFKCMALQDEDRIAAAVRASL
ncbi:MAG: glycosyltransferase family 9 protein [Bacteroidota bacterium]